MNISHTILFGLVFLDYSSRYDGGEDGGSIIGLLEAIGEIWWPMIGLILLILMVTSIFKGIFIESPRRRQSEYEFNLKYPTLQEKQKYYDSIFQKSKLEAEKEWNKEREYHLNNFPDWLYLSPLQNLPEYDIKNLASYAKRVQREVVKIEYNSKGYSTLREYWTYDGEWRQGYWDGQYNYRDGLWKAKTKCDFLRLDMGDIQPKINKAPNTASITETKKEENTKIDYTAPVSSGDDDDLPF